MGYMCLHMFLILRYYCCTTFIDGFPSPGCVCVCVCVGGGGRKKQRLGNIFRELRKTGSHPGLNQDL